MQKDDSTAKTKVVSFEPPISEIAEVISIDPMCLHNDHRPCIVPVATCGDAMDPSRHLGSCFVSAQVVGCATESTMSSILEGNRMDAGSSHL